MQIKSILGPLCLVLALVTGPVRAQDGGTSDGLKVLFDTGQSRIRADQTEVLDTAAGLFREGSPIVMILSGSADTVGNPAANLDLSLARAQAVARALSRRGIPVERLQVLGRGNSELEVPTGDEVSNAENRSVKITWR